MKRLIPILPTVVGFANGLSMLGKRSFLHKQRTLDDSSTIATPERLQELAQKSGLRQRGSKSYGSAWRHWMFLSAPAIRHELSKNLPHPVHHLEFESLAFSLGVAADKGEMPSFSDPGARSGYALDFFCRARLLADLFMDTENPSLPNFWKDELIERFIPGENLSSSSSSRGDGGSFRMVSLGGGPGFDFVAVALAWAFSCTGKETPPIHATILDYEEGWGDLVQAMEDATKVVLQQPNQFSCEWGGKCDITKPLTHPHNAACLANIQTTQLWTCQYCVAENAKLLRESDYVFFRELLEAIPIGAVIILTETTPRLWPEIYELAQTHGLGVEIGFPTKKGPQMVLRKTSPTNATPLLSERDTKLLQEFQVMSDLHEEKVQSGWERQTKKIRAWTPGVKVPWNAGSMLQDKVEKTLVQGGTDKLSKIL